MIPLPSIEGYEFSTPSGGAIEVRCTRTGFGIVLSVDDADYIGPYGADRTHMESEYRIDIEVRAANRETLDPDMRWGRWGCKLRDILPWLDGIEIHGELSGDLVDDPDTGCCAGFAFEPWYAKVYLPNGMDARVPMWAIAQGPMAAAIDWLCDSEADAAFERWVSWDTPVEI